MDDKDNGLGSGTVRNRDMGHGKSGHKKTEILKCGPGEAWSKSAVYGP